MKENWDKISLWIKASEGGFVNNPHDPGGATNYGVTLREFRAACGHFKTVVDLRQMPWSIGSTILKEQYWDAAGCDYLPSGLDYSVADAAFNSGPVQAIKWLQRALGVDADGHYGLITAAAVQGIKDVNAVIDAYDKARLGLLHSLKAWTFFGRGWNTRVNLVTARSHEMARADGDVK